MYRPTILLDCDGVLCDLMSPTLALANQLEPDRATPYALRWTTSWDIFTCLGMLPSTRRSIHAAWEAKGFVEELRPYDGAVAAVRALRRFAEVYVVTSAHHTSKYWHYERTDWLKAWFDIPAHRVVFADNKQLLTGDMFVDDKPENVRRVDMAAFLWTQPYNSAEDLPRISSFAELVDKAAQLRDQLQEIYR